MANTYHSKPRATLPHVGTSVHKNYLPDRLVSEMQLLQLQKPQLEILLGLRTANETEAKSLCATENAQEFIQALIAYINPINKTEYWMAVLPSENKLQNTFLPLMKEHHLEKLYPRLEELVITNRLQIIQTLENPDSHLKHHRGTGQALRRLPTAYWKEVLEKTNDPKDWEAKENKPSWSELMLPITTQGEYLRAVRNALGLDGKDIAKENGYRNADSIKAIETMITKSEKLDTDLVALQKYYAKRTDLCDAQVFAQLKTPPQLSAEPQFQR